MKKNLRGPLLYPTAAKAWLDDPTTNARSKDTHRTWEQMLSLLQHQHPGKRVNEFTEEDLIRFITTGQHGQKLAPKTTIARRTVMGLFFDWAQWKRLVTLNPALGLKRLVRPRNQGTRPANWLSEPQIAAVLATTAGDDPVDVRDRALLMTGFFTGLRVHELASMRWSDIDFAAKRISGIGKGSKPFTVGMPAQLVEDLFTWRSFYAAAIGRPVGNDPVWVPSRHQGGEYFGGQPQHTVMLWDRPMSIPGIRTAVQRRGALAGVPTLAPHDLRRTFINLVKLKKGLEAASKAARHANYGTTQVYLEKAQDAAVAAVEGFELAL